MVQVCGTLFVTRCKHASGFEGPREHTKQGIPAEVSVIISPSLPLSLSSSHYTLFLFFLSLSLLLTLFLSLSLFLSHSLSSSTIFTYNFSFLTSLLTSISPPLSLPLSLPCYPNLSFIRSLFTVTWIIFWIIKFKECLLLLYHNESIDSTITYAMFYTACTLTLTIV